jgi:predicted dehydrogenase
VPPAEAVLIGAGQRGREVFGGFARLHPDLLRFVAVAEPDEGKRERFAREHAIGSERRFASFEDLLSNSQFAALCFNASMDRQHLPSSLLALERGYHLLLEKPMAESAEACLEIQATARRTGRIVQICHPLRFTPFYRRVKELLDDGIIGYPISLTMNENVAHWHFAHSYVRGNWGRVETSGPLILTKCCHDMDVAAWLMGRPVRRVASFGSLTHFRAENAPDGAPERCTDGCPAEKTCPHFAPAVYLTGNTRWPTSVISVDSSLEARRRALETGPYGRCVFRSPNTTVDHQVVSAEFEGGTTFDFAVRAFTADCFRTIRILGSEGELNGHLEKAHITTARFGQGLGETQRRRRARVEKPEGTHLGGDPVVIRNFLRCCAEGDHETAERSLEIAVEGHLLAFAAEQARATGQTVVMAEFRSQVASRVGVA